MAYGAELEAAAENIRKSGHTVHCPTLAGNRPGDDRSRIGLMVNDVIETTGANAAGMRSVADIRGHPGPLAAFSSAMAAEERELKAFMYERLYYHPDQMKAAGRAQDVVSRLFAAYDQDPSTLPDAWRAALPKGEPERSRHLADFIAGMTDRYAVALYEQQTHHLLCPCHQSQFDVKNHCEVIFGPAGRPLPQLPIAVDDEGYLIAQSDFTEPVGPSFWERRHDYNV